ncbi:MAG: class I SAM-dependent methyltransferase [Acidimicrobiia bacterium]|nr:class I SAM-dependent methyltransferase [Acidimicrobiia bacterium]
MHDHAQTHDHHHDHHHHEIDHELAHRNPAEFWDDVYGGDAGDVMWSGNPNGTVEVELADLEGGRALDIGCGEGADALWLAQRGWEVTAVDVSAVAIERAKLAAVAAGMADAVTWRVANVLIDPPDAAAYDLVLMMYPAFHHPVTAETIRTIVGAVAPGGTLLVVHHVVDPDAAAEHGFDPSEFVSVAEIAEALAGSDFTIAAHETRSRPNPPPDSHHADDEVLRLIRSA